MMTILLVAFLVAQDAPVVTAPTWVRRPSGADMARVAPPSWEPWTSARVTISCVARLDGRADDCRVEAETPADSGFAEATLALTESFRMAPGTIDGVPVDDARFTTTISWEMRQEPPAPPPGAPVLDLDQLSFCAALAQRRADAGLDGPGGARAASEWAGMLGQVTAQIPEMTLAEAATRGRHLTEGLEPLPPNCRWEHDPAGAMRIVSPEVG